ncbi:hypothetical protein HUJ04_008273 [Dendroctonus ponderosae]|nr:hypothetical protein HUJ04_008273 [Dendroctonus ponderosae]
MQNSSKLLVEDAIESADIGETAILKADLGLDRKVGRKPHPNPLIQKNLKFLHEFCNLFGKSPAPGGHVDTAFKRSLRNYSPGFDLVWELSRIESIGSTQKKSIKKKPKPRSRLTQTHHCQGHQAPFYRVEDFRRVKADEPLAQSDHVSKVDRLATELLSQVQHSEPENKELFSRGAEYFKSDSESEKEFYSPQEEFLFGSQSNLEQLSQSPDPGTVCALSEVSITNLVSDQLSDPLAETDNQLSPSKKSSSSDSLLGVEETLQSLYKMAEDFANEDLEAADFTDTEHDGSEEGDDELKDVEEMIQQASEELQKVADENQRLITTLDEGEDVVNVTNPEEGESDEPKQPLGEAGDGSVFKFDPKIDAAVLAELEAAEKQAKATAQVITDLKNRVSELLQKEKMTEGEARELEEKNQALKAQMILFEEKTKRIQFILGQANLFDKMQPMQPPLQIPHAEDILPKMLVCGAPDAFMPKIVLCHDRKNHKSCRSRSSSRSPELIPIARKLSQSYNMQEKLVNENASLEDTRYRLQSNLIDKDRTVECLQRQLCSLQTEMRMVHQENVVLNEKLQHCPNASCPKNSRSNSPTREGGGTGVKMSCGPGKGLCPADVENRLQEYSQTTNQLEKQLVDVEQDVKIIQQELLEVQKEREHLEHHRKMLALSPPCHPSPCPSPYPSCKPYPPCGHPPCPTLPCCPSEASGEDQPFKEMKEKYARLQEDFKAKLTEVAGLRADNEKLKELADKAEENRAKLDMKVKELEKKLKELRGDAGDKGIGSREQLIDLQQQLKVHKELYRQAQDELEELRALVEDIQGQLNDYRNKYLEAIQTIEEQRRQIEIMRMENNRISEQVNLEIVRVKNQFQEKLQELAPLPDILKATQVKLQEAQQMHLLAERNNEAMNRELQSYKDKLKVIMDEMALADDDKATGAEQIRETADENKRMADEKLHEIAQLETQLESVREESARQVTRIKDRCEIVRKSTQNQVSDLERQLAQTRACAKQAEKERDDGHVNFLKNSYCSPSEQESPIEKKADPCCCASDY